MLVLEGSVPPSCLFLVLLAPLIARLVSRKHGGLGLGVFAVFLCCLFLLFPLLSLLLGSLAILHAGTPGLFHLSEVLLGLAVLARGAGGPRGGLGVLVKVSQTSAAYVCLKANLTLVHDGKASGCLVGLFQNARC